MKFLNQDTNIINTRTNQQLKLIEASILTVAEACDQFRIGLCSDIIRCKASDKTKQTNMSTQTACHARKTKVGVSNEHHKRKRSMKNKANVGNGRAKKTEIKVYDIAMLGAEQMCEFVKLCYEHNCRNIMTIDEPIFSNLCKHCKPKGGKSIDFFQFLTRAGGKIQYFCGCPSCQNGLTDGCLETY